MRGNDVEAICALSPQQQGMLLESIQAEDSGLYVEHQVHTLEGDLDFDAFRRAWEGVVDRHAILRTAFVWRDQEEPLQVVLRRVELPAERHDWRGLPAAEQEAKLADYLAADRRRGFDLSRAPLLRLALFRLEESCHRFVATHHHITIDGWSLPILEQEFLCLYQAYRGGRDPCLQPLQPSRPYRDYVAWLKRQDLAAAETFWRRTLRGFTAPTPLGREAGPAGPAAGEERYGTRTVRLPGPTTAALAAFARRRRVTFSTLIQGVWALLLGRYSGHGDVVFGTTVSGRPPELDGIESMVGLFINTLPFRVKISPEVSLGAWLDGLQERHSELRRFQHCSSGQVHPWSEVPGSLPLYESLLVFENYPVEPGKPPARGAPAGAAASPPAPEEEPPLPPAALRLGDFRFIGAHTRYALTLLVAAGSELSCRIVYDRRRLDEAGVEMILAHFTALLASLAAGPEPALAALLGRIPESEVPSVRSLPAPGRPAAEGSQAAPRTPAEEILARLWAEVLGVPRVGIHESFLELGGHSLLGTQLMSRVRGAFRVELPLRLLFEAPTVAALSERIEAALRQKQGLQIPPLLPVPRDRPIPLSFAQERLWFLDQMAPGSPVYNIPFARRLLGPLEVPALRASLDEIARRHESLRTTFSALDGQPFQVIAPPPAWELPVVDLCGVPPAQRMAEALRLAAAETRQPFDLARGPLARSALLRLGERDHVFLLTMHHVISDGWSMGVFFEELAALYGAWRAGRPSPLPELPVQYADFAVWQRQWLAGDVLDAQLAYWQRQLGGAPAVVDLPADHPRPAVQSFRGADEFALLPAALGAALQSLSQRQGATLFMTLLAAFKALLCRLTAQDDVSVGSPIAGRTRGETESLIGFFLNTIVLRTPLAGNPTFRELVERVREVALGAYTHQDVPFEKLLEALQPERDLSRTPLFQVFFNVLNFAGGGAELPGLTVRPFANDESGSRFDLTLYASADEEKIRLLMAYSTDLFAPDRMAELLRQYEHLLWQVVEDPETRLADLSLVTPAAQALLPDPRAALDAGWEGAVHTLFSRQASMAPQRLAVADPHDAWTYGELAARSDQLAGALLAAGVRPGDVVAIYGQRSASLVWALLGVLKAGAAFLVLDPAYPAPRLLEYLRLARPRGWLQIAAAGAVPEELEPAAAACAARLELPRRAAAAAQGFLEDFPPGDPGVRVGPDAAACLAFTSGSTGEPKGVVGRHGSLTHFLPWMQQTFGLGDADRFSMLSGLSHDPLQRDVFTPLCLGASLHVPDPEDIAQPGRLAAWMRRQEISVTHLTPALGQLLVQAASSPPPEIPSLRRAFFVGDVLTRRDVSRLQAQAPGVAAVNLYGSTETQRAVGFFLAAGDAHPEREVVPAGRGMKDVQLLVLNAAQRLAGVGELGEICVRSPHLALGYLGDEALTRERFLVNPFTGAGDDRLYRTGDLGRYLPDGNVEFAGRADRQVKIRGFRIEPGDVEAVLGRHPAVREAVVLAREEETGGRRLVAYAVPQGEPAPTVTELHRFLRERMPEYMVPAAFVLLQALPLTPNGKVDRRALPAPDAGRPGLKEAFVGPRNPQEQVLAGIWARLLGLERVGVWDNFFELGGHSLLATRLVSRIRDTFQVELPLRRLFETPTVTGVAAAIEEARAGAAPRTLAIVPIPRERHRGTISTAGELVMPEVLQSSAQRRGKGGPVP